MILTCSRSLTIQGKRYKKGESVEVDILAFLNLLSCSFLVKTSPDDLQWQKVHSSDFLNIPDLTIPANRLLFWQMW